jgi:hypothetical protein
MRGGQRLVFRQQLLRVPVIFNRCIRVLDVQVVIIGLDLLYRHFPGKFISHAVIPPLLFRPKLLDTHGFCLRVRFIARRIRMLIIPYLFCTFPLGEKKEISFYTRIRIEHTVRQNNGTAPPGFKNSHDQYQEKVRGLFGLEIDREISLDTVFLYTAKRRIGNHHIHIIFGFVIP